MRKELLRLAALALSAGIIAFAGGASAAGIAGTDHDLSSGGTGICIYCHTPHNSAATADQVAPLWNHETTTLSSFVPYTNPNGTLDSTPGTPAGVSKACLSCHDGSVAIDSFGGATGSNFMGGDHNLGQDLSNDHPIAMVYNSALATADGELADPGGALTVGAGGLPIFGTSGNAQVECATCHDVHNGPGINKFLRISNSGSALCLNCHLK